MCIEAAEVRPWLLECVPNRFKTQEMCNKVVRMDQWSLKYVSDRFVVLQEMWYVDFDDDDDWLIKWRNAYKKRRAQKSQIKKELMRIAWHPDRVMDCCMSEDEKRWWK